MVGRAARAGGWDRPSPSREAHDVGLLAGLDHAQPAGLALQRALVAQLTAAGLELGVARLQRGDLLALLAGLLVRRDPADRRSDVEVEDEREDGDEGPAAQTVPADARGSHACAIRSTPRCTFLCNASPAAPRAAARRAGRHRAAKPCRQLGYAGVQPSSRLAFAFETPRRSVIIV